MILSTKDGDGGLANNGRSKLCIVVEDKGCHYIIIVAVVIDDGWGLKRGIRILWCIVLRCFMWKRGMWLSLMWKRMNRRRIWDGTSCICHTKESLIPSLCHLEDYVHLYSNTKNLYCTTILTYLLTYFLTFLLSYFISCNNVLYYFPVCLVALDIVRISCFGEEYQSNDWW